ncbi:MAG: Mitogen-activated protein kinase kinase 1 interacting [Pseudomonadota bacterium]
MSLAETEPHAAEAEAEPHADWDAQAARDIVAAGETEAVLITDRNGRVLLSEIKRALPEPLGALLESALSCHAATGEHLRLGAVRLTASVHDNGTLVCGRTADYSVFLIASTKANLGQLLGQARRIFPKQAFVV